MRRDLRHRHSVRSYRWSSMEGLARARRNQKSKTLVRRIQNRPSLPRRSSPDLSRAKAWHMDVAMMEEPPEAFVNRLMIACLTAVVFLILVAIIAVIARAMQ